LELPESFIRLLKAKAEFQGWTKWAKGDEDVPEMDAGAILGWLTFMEARGATEEEIHAFTPMMWRDAEGPSCVHEERRVYEDGKLISGPKLEGGEA